MSDQRETGIGVVLDLEGLFLSGEFGRRPARLASTAPATVASEPVRLEQVFLAEVFGHTEVVEESAPAVPERPVLVLLQGGGRGGLERTTAPYRAVAAVSGVAAAALVLAGLAPGTSHGPGGSPGTEQAQGAPPGRHVLRSRGGPQPGPVRPTTPQGPAGTPTPAASGGGGTASATLTAFTPPAASVFPSQGVAGGRVGAPGATLPTGAAGGGSSPGTPPGGAGSGGGGGMLTPALTVVGNEVSSVGSSANSTAGDLDQNLPVGPVLLGVGTVATSAVNNMGGGTAPTILAGSMQQ